MTSKTREPLRALGFPHYVLNASKHFSSYVIEPFCRSYLEGKTPNPCIACNRHLKFALLQQRRKELCCDYVATGHYARRVQMEDGSFALLRAQALQKIKAMCFIIWTKKHLHTSSFRWAK